MALLESDSQARIQVLHLLGSPTSSWYFDLSVMYGRTCAECSDLDHKSFQHQYVVVYTSGKWGFPTKLDEAGVTEAEKGALSVGAAMAKIEAMQPLVDIVVPHMFCLEGMTRYRALCDMLGIEVLGCPPETCALGQDKFLTKAVCEVAGVSVPKGELLRKDPHGMDTTETARKLLEGRSAPLIVKPAREDNSIGLSLVKSNSPEEMATALSHAFTYDDQILVEDYIAGREVRVAVLEIEDKDGIRLEVLPKLEYVLEDIREQKHKLGTDASGKLLTGDKNPAAAFHKASQEGERICPAQLEPEVHQRIDELAKRAHKAMSCKYYSLFDVRINADGFPFMLESCLFCSFSPYSVIVSLAAKSSSSELQPHPKIFESLMRRAARESHARRSAVNDVAVTGGVKRRKVG